MSYCPPNNRTAKLLCWVSQVSCAGIFALSAWFMASKTRTQKWGSVGRLPQTVWSDHEQSWPPWGLDFHERWRRQFKTDPLPAIASQTMWAGMDHFLEDWSLCAVWPGCTCILAMCRPWFLGIVNYSWGCHCENPSEESFQCTGWVLLYTVECFQSIAANFLLWLFSLPHGHDTCQVKSQIYLSAHVR